MAHSHDSHSHHSHEPEKSRRSLWWVFALSFLYMCAEVAGGLWSGSLALLADAGHMAIDTLAIGLGLFAAWIARKPANDAKTFGYYRAEILAALLNGTTLIVVSFYIFYEAWHRFHSAAPIEGSIMTGIAAGGLVVNLVSLFAVHRHDHHDLNVRGVWLHLLTDTLGSVGAVGAGVLVWKFGWTLADPIISILIGVFILFGAWSLVGDCVNVLLEGVPKGINVDAVRSTMQAIGDVESVHDLHVWMVSTGVNSLSAHVRLRANADSSQVLELLVAALKREHRIGHVTLQLEPQEFSAEDCSSVDCGQGSSHQ